MSSLIEYDSEFSSETDSLAAESMEGRSQTNLLALAWRARWLMVLTVLLGTGGAWLYLQRVVPRYTSESRIYIKRNLPRILSSDVQLGESSSFLFTQAELIRSTPVLLAVANAAENAQLETFRTAESSVGLLKKQLAVQVGQNDDIINVSIELPVAADAAQIVNSVVDAYVSKYAADRRSGTAEVLDILRKEKQRREAELEQRQTVLEEFRRQNPSLAVQVGRENVITKRFATLADALDRTELELINAKTKHNRTQQMYESPDLRPYLYELASNRQTAAEDIRIENRLQLNLEKQLQDIDLSINTLRATWGDGHTRVKLLLEAKEKLQQRLADQLVAIEDRKTAIITAYVETVTQEHQLLEHKRAELQSKYDTQYKLAMQINIQNGLLATLEESATRATNQVDILDDQIKKLNLSENVGAMNVSIMEVAVPSLMPSYPNRSRILALGALLGGLVGFGMAWLRDLLDHRLKSTDEIASTLQLPVLEALPLASGRLSRAQVGTIMVHQPQAMLAEALRSLRTSIHFGTTNGVSGGGNGDASKVIAVTSALSGEGKSVVASNLAIALAQLGRKVLLIDADFRRSCQHEIFGVEAKRGLTSVLAEKQSVADVIVPTSISQLDLLPSGPSTSSPVDLLNNGYFDDLLDDLGAEYDKIVIDSPAVLPVADARIIAALSDSILLVIQAEQSTPQDSLAARDQLWQVGARQLGVVINRVPLNKLSAYGHGYGVLGYHDDPPKQVVLEPEKARVTAENAVVS